MTRYLLIASGVLLTILFALDQNGRVDLKVISGFERQAYDVRVRLSSKAELDPRVVIIDADETSLREHGQYPWPRALMAELTDKLFDDYHIDTLGFDVLFAEPENSFSLKQIKHALSNDQVDFMELEQQSGDTLFAQAMKNRSVVLGIAFENAGLDNTVAGSVGILPAPAFSSNQAYNDKLIAETRAPVAERYSANISTLQEAANRAGFLSILAQDPDGSIRRVGVLNEYDGKLYSSLSLQLVQAFFQDQPEPILVDKVSDQYDALEGIRMLHADIPLDAEAGIYVPYSKPGKAYEYVSATQILKGEYQGDISGAIAIFGTSAVGLVDRRNTPVMPGMPGVEIHANLVSALLDGEFRTKPNWVAAIDIIILVIVGLLLSLWLATVSAARGTLLYVSVIFLVCCFNWYFWSEKLLILAIAPVIILATLLYMLNMVVGFFVETNARQATQKMFGRYIPPEVVSEISSQKDIFSLKPERREMTVLFADIRGFTSIAEDMPPVELSQWLNDFLTAMTKIIHKHGGAVDKYMGDAIMAFWGAPLADPEHAKHSIQAGLEMLDCIEMLNQHYAEKEQPLVRIGLGINTGSVAVGNMGSEFRMAYTVVGDTVNLGSRLETLTKHYQVPMVVSEFTAQQAPGFDYQRLDRLTVPGKSKEVTIYTVR